LHVVGFGQILCQANDEVEEKVVLEVDVFNAQFVAGFPIKQFSFHSIPVECWGIQQRGYAFSLK